MRGALLVFVFWATSLMASEESFLEKLALVVDPVECRNFKVLGPCSIGQIPGEIVQYLEPALLVLVQGKSGAAGGVMGQQLRFFEVGIYDYPKRRAAADELRLCPALPITYLRLRYQSTQDQQAWREASGEEDSWRARIGAAVQINDWGPLWPATGFVVHSVPLMAGALAGLRAVNAATYPYIGMHRVHLPLEYTLDPWQDRMQLLHPTRSRCVGLTEKGRAWSVYPGSMDERFVWLYWRSRWCCRPKLGG